MSETETAAPEETGNDPLEDDALREESEHPEGDDDRQGDDEQPVTEEAADEAASAEDAAQAQAIQSEKDLMKRDQKIDAENVRHAKRVAEIMEEAGNDLIPCPVCMDGIAGWVYLPEAQQLSEEAILRLRQLIGLSGLEGLVPATFAQRCPDCDGQGEVRTGSRVAGYETTTCERCAKKGWIRVGATPQLGDVPATEDGPVTGPTVYAVEAEDPEIRHLRERGFTVIPPMQVQTG